MRKIRVVIVLSALLSTSVLALNNRSAVSLSGLDSASCTVPDPCRTFDVAISKTNDGGEVIVLSSAGYGPFTVTKSVSIISPPAYHAAIAPTSGDAITVNVDNAVVVLRGLTLNGSLGGVNGITFTGQTGISSFTKLYVDNCVISGFSGNGVNFARNGTLFVSQLIARENGTGILVNGSQTGASWASIDHTLLQRNLGDGLVVENAVVAVRETVATANVHSGFWAYASVAGTTADLSADNCQATHASYGFYSGAGAGTARLIVSNSVASFNAGSGLIADDNGTLRASNNTVSKNSFGLGQSGSGVFESRGNNTVRGNTNETGGVIGTFGPI